jgi:malate dehydrogenase (oxaloacetate-decarboxylating)(NADP+)
VLGFPFIFRGALDVRARAINDEMKFAASHALADLTKEDVPDSVLRAYGVENMKFGREYIIPKPLDPRVLLWEAPAVARMAMETGVARKTIDMDEYREQLAYRLGRGEQVRYFFQNKARSSGGKKRVVFAEGEEQKIIRIYHPGASHATHFPVAGCIRTSLTAGLDFKPNRGSVQF